MTIIRSNKRVYRYDHKSYGKEFGDSVVITVDIVVGTRHAMMSINYEENRVHVSFFLDNDVIDNEMRFDIFSQNTIYTNVKWLIENHPING